MAHTNATPDEQNAPSMTEWSYLDCESPLHRGSFDVDAERESWIESVTRASINDFGPKSEPLPEIPALYQDVDIACPESVKFPTRASFINGINQTKLVRSVSQRETPSMPLAPTPQQTAVDDASHAIRRASLPVFSTVFPRVSTPRISTEGLSVRHTFDEPIETPMVEEPVEPEVEKKPYEEEPIERSSFTMEPFRNPAGEVQLLLLSSVPTMVRTPRRKRFNRHSVEKPWSSSLPNYTLPIERNSFSATPVTTVPPDIHPERASMPEEAKTSRRKRFMRAIFGH